MVDIHATREAFDRGEIATIGWVRLQNNIADGLTKVVLRESLEAALCDNTMKPEIEPRIRLAQSVSSYIDTLSYDVPDSYH